MPNPATPFSDQIDSEKVEPGSAVNNGTVSIGGHVAQATQPSSPPSEPVSFLGSGLKAASNRSV